MLEKTKTQTNLGMAVRDEYEENIINIRELLDDIFNELTTLAAECSDSEWLEPLSDKIYSIADSLDELPDLVDSDMGGPPYGG